MVGIAAVIRLVKISVAVRRSSAFALVQIVRLLPWLRRSMHATPVIRNAVWTGDHAASHATEMWHARMDAARLRDAAFEAQQ